ncbi:MAG: hypothetical protein R2681_07800 [Pyrinomonadaceae bacterium]
MRSRIFYTVILVTLALSLQVYSQRGDVNPLEEKRRAEQQKQYEEWKRSNRDPDITVDKRLADFRNQLRSRHRVSGNRWYEPGVREMFRDAIAVEEKYLREHREFLKGKNTGIFRIFDDKDCIGVKVVRIGTGCESYLPESSTFSFRQGFHVTEPIHDIRLVNGSLISNGVLISSIITSLGETKIENIGKDIKQIEDLQNITPAKELNEIQEQVRNIAGGIKINGNDYSNSARAAVGKTYAIRIIAYRVDNISPFVKKTADEIELVDLELFAELRGFPDYSVRSGRRLDTLVVFKIVGKSEDGGLTVIWKMISQKKAPEIKIP